MITDTQVQRARAMLQYAVDDELKARQSFLSCIQKRETCERELKALTAQWAAQQAAHNAQTLERNQMLREDAA